MARKNGMLFFVGAVLIAGSLIFTNHRFVLSEQQGGADKAGGPLPAPKAHAAIVAAWQKAGARVGWMGPDKFGHAFFRFEREDGDVPAFEFIFWQPDVLSRLPQPEWGFGLSLNCELTDAGLKELAGLKKIQYLGLSGTKVTDAGLKELAGLKSLQSLEIDNNEGITDAGLTEVGRLKSLKSLVLYAPLVTDAGLKELAGLKSL